MTASQVLIHFLLGFITSFLGSIPLGSINVAVIRISISQKIKAALFFIVGATLAELFYSFITIHFSGFLLSFPQLKFHIQLVSIPVFILIGFSYWYAKSKTVDNTTADSSQNTFLQGLVIGFLNPLQIPFWLAYGTYFLSSGWIRQDTTLLNIFILGIVTGSSLFLFLIANFSSAYGQRFRMSDGRVNKITAVVFFILAFYQVVSVGVELGF